MALARGGGVLVGGRHRSYLEFAPGPVLATSGVLDRGEPRRAEGHIDEPVSPGASEGVAHDDAEVFAAPGHEGVSKPRGRGVGVFGQQQHPVAAAFDVGAGDSGVGDDETEPVDDDD